MCWFRSSEGLSKNLAFGFLILVSVFGYMRIVSDAHLAEAIYFNGKDANHSLISASKAYVSNPYDKTSLAIVGRNLLLLKDYKGGEIILEDYINFYPYDLNALINLGIAKLLNGKNADSIKERVRKIDPNCVEQIRLR